jgi:hypothetical protein
MSLLDTFTRLENLNHYIQIRNTGTRTELAAKLRISISTLQDYINFMKEQLNAPIEYDHLHKTYFYTEQGSFDFVFQSRSERIIEGEFYEYLQKFLTDREMKIKYKFGGDKI